MPPVSRPEHKQVANVSQSFGPPSALLVLARSGQVEAQNGCSPYIREKEEGKGRTLEKHL